MLVLFSYLHYCHDNETTVIFTHYICSAHKLKK